MDLRTELRALEQLFANRVIITRVVLDADGHEVARVTRVSQPHHIPAVPPKWDDKETQT
jgi:hypothetical protein